MKTIYYAIKMSDGMWEFNRTTSFSNAINESSFIKETLETNPNGRDVKIYESEESWKQAQNM